MKATTTSTHHTAKSPRVAHCHCDHAQQDQMHGKGKRVQNPCNSKTIGKTGYRCTVCGHVHEG